VGRDGSELDPGAALGVGARRTGADEILGTARHVEAQLFVEVALELAATEETPQERAQAREHDQASSGDARSTVAMLATNRFQAAVSWLSRRRPAAVKR
jgi:hypothetical protein